MRYEVRLPRRRAAGEGRSRLAGAHRVAASTVEDPRGKDGVLQTLLATVTEQVAENSPRGTSYRIY